MRVAATELSRTIAPDRARAARDPVWDLVRGAGVLLVVFGHAWRGLATSGLLTDRALFVLVDGAIYLFHMPLFFLISGALFSGRGPFAEFLGKRLRLLIWPMLLWAWIEGLLLMLAGNNANRGSISFAEWLTYPFPPPGVYWFLLALFMVSLIAYGLYRPPRSWRPQILICGIIAPLVLPRFQGGLAFLNDSLNMLPYFLLGGLLAEMKIARPVGGIRVALLALALFVAIEIVVLSPLAGTLPPAAGPLVRAVATLGFLWWLGTFPLPRPLHRGLCWLGMNTMPIFVAHVICSAASRVVLLRLGVTDVVAHLALNTTAGVVFPCLMYLGARRLRIERLAGLSRG